MTLEEVSRLTDVALEQLSRWRDLGLLPEDEPPLRSRTVERVRLIRYAVEHGVEAEEIARVCAEQGDLLEGFVEQLRTPGRADSFDFDEAAAMVGVRPDVLERIWTASGLRDQSRAYAEDIAALRSVAVALDLGLPEDVLLQLIRVFATSQGKIADAASRLFHFYVHEALRAEGLRGAELINATRSVADPLSELIEPAILYFHHKAWEPAIMQDMLLHLREEANPPTTTPGEVFRTIVFVDFALRR